MNEDAQVLFGVDHFEGESVHGVLMFNVGLAEVEDVTLVDIEQHLPFGGPLSEVVQVVLHVVGISQGGD